VGRKLRGITTRRKASNLAGGVLARTTSSALELRGRARSPWRHVAPRVQHTDADHNWWGPALAPRAV